MTYRNYLARVEYEAGDRVFIGHIAGINDVVGFHGDSVAALETAFTRARRIGCAIAGRQS